MRTLSHSEAKAFYDWFGAGQDSQAIYEDVAVDDLVAHADFAGAHSVIEFGCGTGRFADRLLQNRLPADCRYLGLDVSGTMVRIARGRLRPWGERVAVEQTSGAMAIAAGDAAADRFVACYVLDLLSEPDIHELLAEARRVLRPGGLLCIVSSTTGTRLSAKLVGAAWRALYALSPKLVGGCRPLAVKDFLAEASWTLPYRNVVTRFGVSSEIVVAAAR